MLDRTGSPLALVNALALTCAILLAGAWDANNHGHEAVEPNATHCTVDHDAEVSAAASHATVGTAAAAHDHSCVACQLGRATTNQVGKGLATKPMDLPSTALRSEGPGRFESGEHRQRTARGPPKG
ncbi:MAG: hypothetical protein F4X59_04675 [Holophagales bacterium]|nr:hypothetical protein [Holophagales bacterium]MYC09407.1 hypothetical protein [Holophagales bacterium]